MPGCVLRASGEQFQPETFLSESTFVPSNVFRKGERKSESRIWNTSGITVVVSDAAEDFSQQVSDALKFLKSNRAELMRLKSGHRIENMSLDFGVSRKNGFLQGYLFPSELVHMSGEFGMALEVSIYGEY
jgi:hypothetical protein